MKELELFRAKYVYFTKYDKLASAKDFPLANSGLPLPLLDSFSEVILNSTNLRFVLKKSLYDELYWPLFFYWIDDTDSNILDEKILQGSVTEDDFKTPVRLRYENTICFECRQRWHTLILADPPALLNESDDDPYCRVARDLFRAGNFIHNCPGCDTKLRSIVVKILGKSTKYIPSVT